MHVGHDDRAAAGRGGAANPFAPRNADTGRPALERAEDEFALPRKIEAGPIELGEAVIDQRRHVGAIGDEVALAVDQRGKLPRQLIVEARFVGGHLPNSLPGSNNYRAMSINPSPAPRERVPPDR